MSHATQDLVSSNVCSELGGKYLTFMLDNEEYGLAILKVREIIGIMDITNVPQTPDFVEGVINLRGKVIPVIDLRTKFGLPRTEYNDQTCIIVVDVGMLVGIIVDTVREVHDIPGGDIEPAPQLGGSINTDFILGMGKVKDEVKILLDIDKVLVTDEFVQAAATL
ncbi:MAG: Chemotaxis protein CheW [Phycisphaerae bacterium]|nr:Chemotaxis protein CheW [Phycisphaerae bacterium]